MVSKATDKIEMSWMLKAKPKAVFDAWMSSDGHAAMTGGGAEVDPRKGGPFSVWDGYIWGKTTTLDKRARKIVQTWRTAEFAGGAPDSRIEVHFKALKGNCQVMLKHTRLMPGDGAKYTVGWYEHYLEPMTAHFGGV